MSALLGAESTSRFLLASQPIGRRIVVVCSVLVSLAVIAMIVSAAHGQQPSPMWM
jgi:hypothetical protein